MARQTRSSMSLAVIASPQNSDNATNIDSEMAKEMKAFHIKTNPWCMSDEQIDRISYHFSRVGQPKPCQQDPHHQCVTQDALSPIKMDYLIGLLADSLKSQRSLYVRLDYRRIDWDAIAETFNEKFSGECEPRTVQVLKCAMWGKCQNVRIAVFRDRCRRAHEGTDNSWRAYSLTPAELEHRLLHV